MSLKINKDQIVSVTQYNQLKSRYYDTWIEGGKNTLLFGLIKVDEWDAGYKSSYSGSGTTWYDLSGNRNDMTLINGVSFSRSSSGVMQLDGTNDYIELPSFNISTTNHTIIGASRYAGAGPRGRIFSSHSNNWLMGHWNNNIKTYHADSWVASPAVSGTTDWLISTAVENYSADLWTYYCNGAQIASNSSGTNGPNGLSFGNWRQGGVGSELSIGEIGFFMVYNRILSTEEINQNLNAVSYTHLTLPTNREV